MLNFKKECKLINLTYEYPGYVGEKQWAIITDLTEAEILNKYTTLIQNFKPFIVLPSTFNDLRNNYIWNEKKHYWRSKRKNDSFNFSEHTVEHHPELQLRSTENEYFEKEQFQIINKAIKSLHPLQMICIIKFFFCGESLHQISIEENKSYSTIYESYLSALSILKKLLKSAE